jgi:hypothetical protein
MFYVGGAPEPVFCQRMCVCLLASQLWVARSNVYVCSEDDREELPY